MAKRRPRWVLPFLRQLMLTGDIRLAAERAGVGVETVVERVRRDGGFAGWCEASLRMRVDWLARVEAGRIKVR